MRLALSALVLGFLSAQVTAATTEFCLQGELDLATRLQGMSHRPGEWTPTRWCVVTGDHDGRAAFAASGKSNPDIAGDWTVQFLPPDTVRIVNRDAPPDIEFQGVAVDAYARRHRRIDPRRLLAEIESGAGWEMNDVERSAELPPTRGAHRVRVLMDGRQVIQVETSADLPLRGRVPVVWTWDWSVKEEPAVSVVVDGKLLFRGRGGWRELTAAEARATWAATAGAAPTPVPGENWPARVNMRLLETGERTWLVRGVRTGFQHLVVDTADGLVIADAPAGWVELHQVPPMDLVPGQGISGLSEGLVDFLRAELPDRPIHAVVLTHPHDDHAGGARAFAAAGARLYAPELAAPFLHEALNRPEMPPDRLRNTQRVAVFAVRDDLDISGRVRVVSLGANPHADASLGVWVVDAGLFFVSDLHVPRSQLALPSADRLATDCWFAAWATANLPPDVRVLNSHSAPMTLVSTLSRYLQDPACRARAAIESGKTNRVR